MNYTAEIKGFFNSMEINRYSTGQIALWHALMHINNRCSWHEWFSVSNYTLEFHTGLSKAGIQKARNALKQYGLIDFKANGTKATEYTMISIADSSREDQNTWSDSSLREA